jgi:hypothetical protein
MGMLLFMAENGMRLEWCIYFVEVGGKGKPPRLLAAGVLFGRRGLGV